MLSGGLHRCPAAHGMAYSVLCSLASLREHRRRESLMYLSREIRACDTRVNVGPNFMFFNGNLKSGMKKIVPLGKTRHKVYEIEIRLQIGSTTEVCGKQRAQ